MAGPWIFFPTNDGWHFFGIQRSQKQMQLSGSIWMNMDQQMLTTCLPNQPNADAYSMS